MKIGMQMEAPGCQQTCIEVGMFFMPSGSVYLRIETKGCFFPLYRETSPSKEVGRLIVECPQFIPRKLLLNLLRPGQSWRCSGLSWE